MDVETADDDFVVIVVADDDEEEFTEYIDKPEEIKTENAGAENKLLTEVTIKKEEYLDEEQQDCGSSFYEQDYDFVIEFVETKLECDYFTMAPEDGDAIKVESSELDYHEFDSLSDDDHSSLENQIARKEKRKFRFNVDVAEEKHRYTMLKPFQRKSIVQKLCEKNPALRKDKESLIQALCHLMKQTKPPPPPQDYYFVNHIKFECVRCNALTDSEGAAARHWQEKHGERYLVCYACGVDFRSATNLYKHEKRCDSPDALVVLKARALCIGPRGRGRPYVPSQPNEKVTSDRKSMFACSHCPAMYRSITALQTHENAHEGRRPYRCQHCPAAYTSRSGLTKHGNKHWGRKFICDHCDRAFTAKSPLIAHLTTHNRRPYVCELCERSFSVKFALQYHMEKSHNQAPPAKICTICNNRYTRMSALKKHMQKEHEMQLVTKKMFYRLLPLLSETQVKQALVVYKSQETEDKIGKEIVKKEEIGKKEEIVKKEEDDKQIKENTEIASESVKYATNNCNDTQYGLDMPTLQYAVDNITCDYNEESDQLIT